MSARIISLQPNRWLIDAIFNVAMSACVSEFGFRRSLIYGLIWPELIFRVPAPHS